MFLVQCCVSRVGLHASHSVKDVQWIGSWVWLDLLSCMAEGYAEPLSSLFCDCSELAGNCVVKWKAGFSLAPGGQTTKRLLKVLQFTCVCVWWFHLWFVWALILKSILHLQYTSLRTEVFSCSSTEQVQNLKPDIMAKIFYCCIFVPAWSTASSHSAESTLQYSDNFPHLPTVVCHHLSLGIYPYTFPVVLQIL